MKFVIVAAVCISAMFILSCHHNSMAVSATTSVTPIWPSPIPFDARTYASKMAGLHNWVGNEHLFMPPYPYKPAVDTTFDIEFNIGILVLTGNDRIVLLPDSGLSIGIDTLMYVFSDTTSGTIIYNASFYHSSTIYSANENDSIIYNYQKNTLIYTSYFIQNGGHSLRVHSP